MIDHTLICSGLFYPDSREETDEMVRTALSAAASSPGSSSFSRAVIVPHGSYDYILEPLAAAWHAAAAACSCPADSSRDKTDKKTPKHAVLLLPAHAPHPEGLEGFFIPDADTLQTLSGTLPVDTKTIERVFTEFSGRPQLPYLHRDTLYIREEPALELNFPFIEHVFGNRISILPIFCSTVRSRAARLLGKIISSIDTPDTLYAVSSNLTGSEPEQEAVRHAASAVSWFLKRNGEKTPLLEAVRKHELSLCNPLPLEGLRRAGITDSRAQPLAVTSSSGHSMKHFSSVHAENSAEREPFTRTGSGKQRRTTFYGGCICLKQP